MRLSHPDYIKLVIGVYKNKRANNELSLLLSQPTPAGIRQECSNVYQERYEKKDEPALRAFFGPGEHGRQFLEVIENFDLTKFKPIGQYLKKEGEKGVTDKSLELLAWLINFRHRPFVFGKEVILSEEEVLIIENTNDFIDPVESESKDEEAKEPERSLINEQAENAYGKNPAPNLSDVPQNKKENESLKRALAFFLVLIVSVGAIIYTIWQQNQDKQLVMGNVNTGCMYWAGDHYDTIPCTENRKGQLILPLDEEKMKNFRKITREDTITEWSIGKIYYLKNNRVLEYYTADGNHPVDVTRTLKVLSRHIFDTYLRKKEASGKDSLVESNRKP